MKNKKFILRFQYKLFLTLCTIIVIPLLFVIFIYSRQITSSIENHFVEFMDQVTDQMNRNIATSIKNIDKVQFFYIFDPDLLKIMKKDKYQNEVERIRDFREMDQYFVNALDLNEDIVSIYVHSNNGVDYSFPWVGSGIDPGLESKVKAHVNSHTRRLFISPTGKYQYVSSVKNVITIGRECIDPNTNRYLGYSLVNISYKLFDKVFENLNTDPRISIFVHNGENIIYHSKKNSVNENDLKGIIAQTYRKNSSFKTSIGGSSHILVSNHSDYTGLTVVEYVSMDLINESALKNIYSYWLL